MVKTAPATTGELASDLPAEDVDQFALLCLDVATALATQHKRLQEIVAVEGGEWEQKFAGTGDYHPQEAIDFLMSVAKKHTDRINLGKRQVNTVNPEVAQSVVAGYESQQQAVYRPSSRQ